MSRSKIAIAGLATIAIATGACKDEKKAADKGPAKPVEQTTAPTPTKSHALGIESPRTLGYVWGKGSKNFTAASKLLKEEARDWKAIAEACEAAIAADKNHFGAHRLLGIARANTGEHKAAAEHLSIALAADWLRWGPGLAEDKSLVEFFATDDGKALLAQNDAYKENFYRLAGDSVLVVAKRTKWKRPSKTGRQWAATRAELFAYHLDEERYLRLTHTGESVVGFVRSPSGDRVAALAVTHFEFSDAETAPIASARVIVLDAKTFEQLGKSARLKKASPSLALYYGAGEELLLDAAGKVFSVDFEGGKLAKSRDPGVGGWEKLSAKPKHTVLYVSSEFARVVGPPALASSGPKTVTAGEVKIELPAAGGDAIRRVSASPDRSRLTIVGSGDPCEKDSAQTIYVVDASSGALKHVHRGGGLQTATWIDGSRFVFEAEAGELRVYDVASNNTTHTIKNRYGISLGAVSNMQTGEYCKKAPPVLPEPGPGLDEDGPGSVPDGEPVEPG